MYHWYQSSTICYAYLQDVSTRLNESDGAKTRYRRIHATYDKFRSDNSSSPEQTVYVLDRGFVGWQEVYGEDERLTEEYRKELWQDGYWG